MMKIIKNVDGLWAIMIALTLTTYAIAKLGYSGTTVMMFLLFTALVKATIIIADFMEVRGVSLLWRTIMYGWLWIVTATIAITYMIGST